MRAVAQNALTIAIEKLTEIVGEGPRHSSTEYSDEGKPTKTITPQNVDLDAAKALASLAVQALKLAGTGKGAESGKGAKLSVQLDLWDNPGNWQLAKPK